MSEKRYPKFQTEIMEIIPVHIIFKCIHLWRRLCDRHLMKKNSWMNTAGSEKMKCWIWWLSPSPRPVRSVNGAIVVGYKLAGYQDTGGDPGNDPAPFAIISVISICYSNPQ